jgi:endonuclease YncB( thermonuclease family)
MKLEALDNFYTDETKQVLAGRTFTVESPETAKDLIKAGLAQEVEEDGIDATDAGEPDASKAEATLKNKAKAPPANK